MPPNKIIELKIDLLGAIQMTTDAESDAKRDMVAHCFCGARFIAAAEERTNNVLDNKGTQSLGDALCQLCFFGHHASRGHRPGLHKH